MNFVVFCDGSARGNGTPNACGAYAYAITNEAKDVLLESGVKSVKDTTNQRMELEAALAAYKVLVKYLDFGKDDTVIFYSDSKYLIDCYCKKWYKTWLKKGWKTAHGTSVSNSDLWKKLIPLFDNPTIEFDYVPAHQSDVFFQSHEFWNNWVDKLAQKASADLKKKLEGKNNEDSGD